MITTGAFSDINQFQGGVLFGFNVCTAAGVGFACYATVWLVLRNKALDGWLLVILQMCAKYCQMIKNNK
jgi:hypothetical protein